MIRGIVRDLRTIGYSRTQYAVVAGLLVLSSFLAVLPVQFLAGLASVLSGMAPDQPIVAAFDPVAQWWFEGVPAAVSMIVLFLVSSVAADVVRNVLAYRTLKASHRVSHHARTGVVGAALKRDWLFNRSRSDLRSRAIDAARTDVERIEILTANLLLTALSDVLDLVFMSVVLLVMFPWPVTAVLLACLVPLVAVSYFAGRVQRAGHARVAERDAELADRIASAINGLEISLSTRGEDHELDRIRDVSAELAAAHTAVDRSLTRFYPISGLLKNISIVAAISVYVYSAESLNPGDILLLFGYSLKFYAPVSNYINYYKQLQVARASLGNVTDLVSTGCPLPQAVPASTVVRELRIRGPQITGGEVTLKPGDRVLLQGPSGVGKTTLLRHVAGACEGGGYEAVARTAGGATACGYELRGLCATVNQNPSVLNVTLVENVVYPITVADADTEEATRLLKTLGFTDEQIHDPRRLSELSLSGGEQRRLALARAIYSDRPVMAFDEVEANLDRGNRALVRSAIAQLSSDKIVVIVSHDDADYWASVATRRIMLHRGSE